MPDIIKKLQDRQLAAVSIVVVVLAIAFVWLLGHVSGLPDAMKAHEQRLRDVEARLEMGPEVEMERGETEGAEK